MSDKDIHGYAAGASIVEGVEKVGQELREPDDEIRSPMLRAAAE